MIGTKLITLCASSAMGTLTAQVVTVVIAFLSVLYILTKTAWKPILAAIDERRESIRRSFEDIEKRQAQLNSQIKDYEERLRLIDEEARQRLNKAVDEGRKVAAEIEAKAKADAEASLTRARQAIQIEVDKARIELRNEMVALSVGATERLLHTELNDERHRALVASFIAEMQDKSAS